MRRDFTPTRRHVPRFREMSLEEKKQAVAKDPAFANIICRCEVVTEAEIRDCIRRKIGATTVDGVKRRTRAGMGRCQGGFCQPKVVAILAEELGVSPEQICKDGDASRIVVRG